MIFLKTNYSIITIDYLNSRTEAVLCTRPKFQDQDRDQDRGVQDQDRDRVVQDRDRDQDRVVQDRDRDQDRIIQDQDLSLNTINVILSCSVTYSHYSDQMLIIFIVMVFIPKSSRSHEGQTIAKDTISRCRCCGIQKTLPVETNSPPNS